MATNLTPEQLDRLRQQARRSGRFVDPAALATVQYASFYRQWAAAVLGHDYLGVEHVEPWEITLLADALAAEPNRPVPAAVLERRAAVAQYSRNRARAAAEAVQAARDVWNELRARLPVPVIVGHNWTLPHNATYQAGVDHIVVTEELHVGRLHRPARNALCEPEHSAAARRVSPRNGTSRDPLRGLERADDGQDRIPTCKACLKTARRIARDGT